MFAKLFGNKNRAIKTSSPPETGAAEDAESIHRSVDYLIVRAAWDEYITLKKEDEDFQYGDTPRTPCWKALEKVREHKGDFTRLAQEDRPLLQALRDGFLIYADVLHVLIDHHSDEDAARDLYKKYPELHDHVPPEYDNPQHIIEVLVEVIRDYQWQLEQFSMKHGAAIDAALDPAHGEQIAHHAVALPDAHDGAYDNKESYLTDEELGIAPPPNPLAEKLANTVLDKLEAMEASLEAEKPGKAHGTSVLDQEELAALATQGDVSAAPKAASVLDQEELKKLQGN